MKKLLVIVAAVMFVLGVCQVASAEEKTLFGFEKDPQGWAVPEWALEKEDCVAKTCDFSAELANEGTHALKVVAAFPGKMWTSAIVENQEYFDWSPYKEIAVDVYVPKEAPAGLKGKIILTVGESWTFTEMARGIALTPGAWVTIRANIAVGSEDWKKTVVDDNFRKDVRKVAVRVESNKAEFNGPIYIDNFRLVTTS